MTSMRRSTHMYASYATFNLGGPVARARVAGCDCFRVHSTVSSTLSRPVGDLILSTRTELRQPFRCQSSAERNPRWTLPRHAWFRNAFVSPSCVASLLVIGRRSVTGAVLRHETCCHNLRLCVIRFPRCASRHCRAVVSSSQTPVLKVLTQREPGEKTGTCDAQRKLHS